MPASATLLVVCGDCIPMEHDCRYVDAQFEVREILSWQGNAKQLVTERYGYVDLLCTRSDKESRIHLVPFEQFFLSPFSPESLERFRSIAG